MQASFIGKNENFVTKRSLFYSMLYKIGIDAPSGAKTRREVRGRAMAPGAIARWDGVIA
jgi:hypothetical protein